MPRGGYQPGAGRPKGKKNLATIEKDKAESLMKQRILSRLNPLLNAQFSLAEGVSYVYKVIDTGKGKESDRKHTIVTNPEEIKKFLDEHNGKNGSVDDVYYYITTEAPDIRAIDSMLDRVFGKAKQSVDMKGSLITDINPEVKKLIEKAIDSILL